MASILVLGGSGRTGKHVLSEAAARGHRVRALVRDPQRVQAPDGVELVVGDPSHLDDVRAAAQGVDAVIDALNNSRASDNPWAKPVSPPTFMTDAARNVLTALSETGARRFIVVSAMGAGDDWARISPVFRALVKGSNLRLGYADHDGVDALVRASDVDWTLVRATMLTDEPATVAVRAAEAGTDPEKPGSKVSRAGLARFLIDILEDGAWVRRTPKVWTPRNGAA